MEEKEMSNNWIQPSYEPNLVSVIVPCHNQGHFLQACLESIKDQKYRPLEVIIVDDGSTDGTRQIMKDFQSVRKEDLIVKCIFQSQHGAPHARNEACRQTEGEYIQYLDADDILCPEKLSDQVMVFKNNGDVDVVYGDGQYLVDFEGIAKKGRLISRGPSLDMVESLLLGKWVPPFSYLSRRSAVQNCGPWDKGVLINQDFEYFLRMAIRGCRFRFKKSINGLYRKHSFNTISEQSVLIRGRTTRRILAGAEHCLSMQGTLNEKRIRALAESHRRIARQVYSVDKELFRKSLDDVIRLCPKFMPEKQRAKFMTSIIGFRNYERLAAMISPIIYRNKIDWY